MISNILFSQTGYQDMPRMPTDVDSKHMNALNLVKFTLPGSTFVVYGEEIGMVDGDLSNSCQGTTPEAYCDPAGLITSVNTDDEL